MQAVIIAAGESSRFWPLNNGRHKSQVKLLGKSLIYWTIKGLASHGVKDFVVVERPDRSMAAQLNGECDLDVRITYVPQSQPLGTGNALWQAKPHLTEPFFVCWPNKINSADIAEKILKKRETGASVVLVGAKTQTPWDYGVARFEGDLVKEIVENPPRGSEPSDIKVIGSHFLEPDFFEYYEKLPAHHEADLIDAINAYLKVKPSALVLLERDVPALKYPWELFGLADILLNSSAFVPTISATARIGKNVILEGPVHVGERAVIKEFTVLQGPCFIGDDCEIGFHNVLRPGTILGNKCKTGSFCELKRSIVGEDTHFHSGYVGDSIIGSDCRFGAGFITANRRIDRSNIFSLVKGAKVDSGLSSFGVVTGNDVHTGISAGTMPGIFIGSHAVIGPGVQIFKNVQDGTIFYHSPSIVEKTS